MKGEKNYHVVYFRGSLPETEKYVLKKKTEIMVKRPEYEGKTIVVLFPDTV